MTRLEMQIAIGKSLGRPVTMPMPDYPENLNACREFEQELNNRHKYSDDVRSLYWDYLALNADGFPDRWECCWHTCMASSLERCEAYLKARQLWKYNET